MVTFGASGDASKGPQSGRAGTPAFPSVTVASSCPFWRHILWVTYRQKKRRNLFFYDPWIHDDPFWYPLKYPWMGLFGTGLATLEQLECTGHDVFMINFYAYGGTLGEIRTSIQHVGQSARFRRECACPTRFTMAAAGLHSTYSWHVLAQGDWSYYVTLKQAT